MTEKVDVVFNYGGRWVLTPHIVYLKKLTHLWEGYDPDLLSYIDICSEYSEKLGFNKVGQLICIGPFGRYYVVKGDAGIRILQSALSSHSSFRKLQLFAVDEGETIVQAPDITQYGDITQYNEPFLVTVDPVTDGESSEEEENENEPVVSDYNSDELEFFEREKSREVNENLDNFLELEKGMSFKDLDEAKRIVSFYSIVKKKGLRVVKSDRERVRYRCDVGCPFVCLISEVKDRQGFEIKTLKKEHTCQPAFKNRRATQQALAHYFKNKIQNNPKYKVKDMRQDVDQHFSLNISFTKMKRVKRIVLEKLDGSYYDEFNKLESYAQELRDSNPGSDVVINISKDALEQGRRKFLRMYVCFSALKNGFRSGLRPFIGVDGTFLKGKFKGILLVALGQDSMKHFYPLAWAVVDRETTRTWKWFLELLRSSLSLANGEGLTLMSDMQKGLIEAVGELLPKAQHRWCARHVEANWAKTWRGLELKKLMWWSAWSTYEEEFEDQLKIMGSVSEQAVKDLLWYPPQHWCRAYFDTVCKNNSCDNNFTESFNKWILVARAKPIIKMMEDIRIKVMSRLKDLEEQAEKWTKNYSPYAIDLYNDFKIIAHGCVVQANGDLGYEVTEGVDRHVVSLVRRRCTCRTWDLTGIPCPHAIKALQHDKKEPQDEIHWWYSKEAYMSVYQHKIQPVRGEKFWNVHPSHAMEPPEMHKMVGRPRVKRVREKNEARKREGLWSTGRKGLKMSCGHCGAADHNRRTCPILSAPQPSEESVFMSTPGFSESSSQQVIQLIDEIAGPSKKKRKSKEKPAAHSKKTTKTSTKSIAPSRTLIDEDETEDDDENEDDENEDEDESEDEQLVVRPRTISEAKTRLQMKKLRQQPTGTRKINFRGDDSGVSMPTNLPYSPKKLTWKGKSCVTSSQLTIEKEKRIGKLKAKRGKQ